MSEKTFLGADTGGATAKSLAKPRLVKPRLNHRFSIWLSGNSIINVYLIRTERNSNVVMVTYFDRESERPYAVSAIDNANVAINILYDAAERFQELHPDKPNPFRQFLDSEEFDEQMMKDEFINMLSRIFYKGEQDE
jgi:hypothetical protein